MLGVIEFLTSRHGALILSSLRSLRVNFVLQLRSKVVIILAFLLLEGIAFVKFQGPVTSIIEMLLRDAVVYISGITTAMFGTFFLWLVHTLDFKITRDFRWIFPTACYAIALFNLWSLNFAGPEFSSSSIQAIPGLLVLVFLIVVVYIVWKAFGPKTGEKEF